VGADECRYRAPVDEAAKRAAMLPHREKYLILVDGFMRRLLELHSDLIDEVEMRPDGRVRATSPRRMHGPARHGAGSSTR
jgi:hypothetical protein